MTNSTMICPVCLEPIETGQDTVSAVQEGIKVEVSGIAWAGFWIALGLYLSAGVMSGQVHIPNWIKP